MLLLFIFEVILKSEGISVDVLTSSSSMTSLLPSHLVPDFKGPIQNVTVAVGREAVLSCSVTDLGHYKVGWMKADDQTILSLHTRVITHNPRISVTHDDKLRTWQLHIRQLKESDRGCYMCQINTSAMKKTLGCIEVQVPPDIDDAETSGDITASEGDNVTLICKATGQPEPRILWRREDGNHIILRTTLRETDTVDTFSGSALNLLRLERRQMGAYLCIASNDVPPAVSKRITLNINFAPLVQVFKPLVGASLGNSAKLKCDVEAFPSSSHYWIKDHDEILLNGSKHLIHEKRTGVKITMILTVINITPADFGNYQCVGTNAMGKSDGSIRLYETKIVTTTTTTTTTTTEVSTILNTTPNFVFAQQSTVSAVYDLAAAAVAEEEPSENWLFPSVAPAPLELETQSPANSVCCHCFALRLVLVTLFVFR